MTLLTLHILPAAALAQISGFGPWNSLITFLMTLLGAAGGIGVATGIGLLALAHGREDKIETGKKVLEGSLGGFLIGAMAIAIYDVISRVVVGF